MTMQRFETLLVELRGSRLYVTLNRPAVRNALNARMVAELNQILSYLETNKQIRSLVLQGIDGMFCAGGDIKQFRQIFQGEMSAAEVAAANREVGALLERLNKLPQTVVMLIAGAAIGGGFGLVCVSDVAITTANARFSLSETSLGVPPAQIAAFAVERIGFTQARRLMLTAARFQGEEAKSLGIVHYVAADDKALGAMGEKLLAEIENCAPTANALTKAILHSTRELSLPAVLDKASHHFADAMLGVEGREGVAAFLEKRRPSWADEGS